MNVALQVRRVLRSDQWNYAWCECMRFDSNIKNDILFYVRHPVVEKVWTGVVAPLMDNLGQYE